MTPLFNTNPKGNLAIEPELEARVAHSIQGADAAHDLAHIRRVVKAAREICREEGGDFNVVIPAAWLHDLVSVPKSSSDRSQASRLSAAAAQELLRQLAYPEELLAGIGHAIEAHSFSAALEPRTVEARIVQDADRLDALGAIGLARCFATAGAIGSSLYHEADPFARTRPLDDRQWAVDHVPNKLLKVAETMRTATGRRLARERAVFIQSFLSQLATEITDETQPT